MAIDKENLSPGTPLPDGPSKVASEKAVASPVAEKLQDLGEEVQVPSTAPQPIKGATTNKPEEIHAQDRVEKGQAQAHVENEDLDNEDEASDSELPEFDWHDLRTRYTKAFQDVNDREDKLLEEFDEFSDVIFHVVGFVKSPRTDDLPGFLSLGSSCYSV